MADRVLLTTLLLAGCAATPAPSTVPPPPIVEASPGAEAAPLAPSDEAVGRFRCEVEVEARGAEVSGEASGGENDDVAKQALRAACEAIREQHGLDCEDRARVSQASRRQTMTVINGKVSRSMRIGLRVIHGTFEGRASSDTSNEEACQRAVRSACAEAPAGSHCDSRGLYCQADEANPALWRCTPKPPPRRGPKPGIFGGPGTA